MTIRGLNRTYLLVGTITLGMLGWVVVYPQDMNAMLAILWNLIAARGVYKALHTFRRVRDERIAAEFESDPVLLLLARGNVRRSAWLAIKLSAMLVVGLSILLNVSNVTVSRFLIVVVLLLMSMGAELDDDEIGRFDDLSTAHRKSHRAVQPPTQKEAGTC